MKRSKRPSIFYDLSIPSEREKALRRVGVKIEKAVTVVSYIVCPLCCKSRPLRRTGIHRLRTLKQGSKKTQAERSRLYNPDKELRFDLFDIENSPFVSVRVSQGRRGFIEKAIIRFQDIARLPEKDREILLPFLRQIKNQCTKTLEVLKDLV
jgi:hypothetical protein